MAMKGWPVVLSDFVDGADVGMVQGRSGLGFALETVERLAILGQVFGQELQRDEAAQGCVFGFVDDTHPAAAQLFDNAVVRDGFADHRDSGAEPPRKYQLIGFRAT